MFSTLRDQQREMSKNKILEAAAILFRKKGYEATGIDEIMKRAGLTAGAFYAHFKSKKKLLAESLQFALDQSFQKLTANITDLPPEKRIEYILKRYLSIQHRDQADHGCPLVSIGVELARQDQAVRDVIAKHILSLTGIVSDSLVEMPDVSPEDRVKKSLQIISTAVGALMLSRMTKGNDISEKLLF